MIPARQCISVIICAYSLDRWELLLAAVRALQAQTLPAKEIIVVIDHHPALFTQAKTLLPGVIVLENNAKQGLSNARNTGIAAAQGELIAFLDDDACPPPLWLEEFDRALQPATILGAGSAVVPAWQQQRPGWFPAEFYWVVGCSYLGMPTVPAEIRNPIGASMCIRRKVFEEVGGFRSEIGRIGTRPIGCEETELCIRARQQWPLQSFRFLPSVSVSHVVPAHRATWSYFFARCYAEGLSKAGISRLVGSKASLSTENNYTFRTLPQGFLRNLHQALFKRDRWGLARAAAIVLGLTITTLGYVIGICSPTTIHPNRRAPAIADSNLLWQNHSTGNPGIPS
ncbi:glycosyltransferase family 2 protein [Tengunoibacter tsumagoiensis]|uniref:Glycosyl transferase family 2 n=1 Tax=Tengunoibacter tsumagoiensis TaxID=2014871 RepID=A0A401ZY27_9CHLR|nr:glycosyltransferase family 2 protein [Tengunoibacter tsumagoiensis]GCE11740.1 glycosyl transferase family 2 [Tengunoibacter tsumagoiensis]